MFVSAISLWEIAIKFGAGRSDTRVMTCEIALDLALRSGYFVLDVKSTHALAVAGLPFLHRDPFDRMLVAQALSEPLRLLTRDTQVAAYSDTVILV